MRKTISLSAAAILIAFAFASIVRAADIITTVSVKGEVSFSTKGGEWKPLEKGKKLKAGDEVRTGSASEATLRWFDGNLLKISPLTEVKLTSAASSGATEKTLISLDKGRVYARAKKLPTKDSVYQIKTPYIICGVRGTEFFVEHEIDKKSTVQVVDGAIDVTAQNMTKIVEAAFWTVVEPARPPEDPKPLENTDLENLRKEAAQAAQDAGLSAAPSPEEVKQLNDATQEAADTAIDQNINQTLDDLLIDNMNQPADECCNY